MKIEGHCPSSLRERQLAMYHQSVDKGQNIASAEEAAKLTAVCARKQVGCAHPIATGIASAARIHMTNRFSITDLVLQHIKKT